MGRVKVVSGEGDGVAAPGVTVAGGDGVGDEYVGHGLYGTYAGTVNASQRAYLVEAVGDGVIGEEGAGAVVAPSGGAESGGGGETGVVCGEDAASGGDTGGEGREEGVGDAVHR